MATPETARALAAEISGLDLAAVNSPRAITMAGTNDAIARLEETARARGIPFIDLGLDYPFHSSLMEPVRTGLIADLNGLKMRIAGFGGGFTGGHDAGEVALLEFLGCLIGVGRGLRDRRETQRRRDQGDPSYPVH